MCIIISKPANRDVSEAILKRCYDNNSDGWGIMWADTEAHKVRTLRGLGTFNEFMTAYDTVKTKHLFVHFRWKTHGKIDIENCHPFPVGRGHYVMHNGVFSGYPNDDRSDTWHFANKTMMPEFKKRAHAMMQPRTWKSGPFSNLIQTNRLAFLAPNGDSLLCGNWITEDGLQYSNGTFRYSQRSYNTGWTDWDYYTPGCAKRKSETLTPSGYQQPPFRTLSLNELATMDYKELSHYCSLRPGYAADTLMALVGRQNKKLHGDLQLVKKPEDQPKLPATTNEPVEEQADNCRLPNWSELDL